MIRAPVHRSVAWLMASHAVVLLVGFAIAVVLAREGPHELGRYRLGQAILMYLIVGADAGLTLIAVREIARQPGELPRYAGPVIVVRAALAAALFGAATVAVVAIGTDASAFYVVMFAAVFPSALSLLHVLQGMERQAAVAVIRMVNVAAAGAVGLVAYLWTGSLVALVVPTLVVGLATALVLATTLRTRLGLVLSAGDPLIWRQLLIAGFPFFTTALAVQLVSNADALIIGWARGSSELGLYAAAYVLAGQTLFLAGPIAWAIYPRLAKLHGTPALTPAVARLFGALGALVVPFCLGAALLADLILTLLYGEAYRAAAPVLALLMVMPLIGFYNVGMAQVLNASDRQGTVARVAMLAAGTNVALNVALVPTIGISGAAVAAIATEAVTAVAYTATGRGVASLVPARSYAGALPAALVMSAVLVGVRAANWQPALPIAVIAGALTYAVALGARPPESIRPLVRRILAR